MEDNSQSPLKQIRTFQGDVAEALQKQNASLVSLQRTEQTKREKEGIPALSKPEDEAKGRKILLLAVGSILLIGGGVLATWYSFDQYKKRSAPPTIATPENRFIAAETSLNIDTTGLNRAALINSIIQNIDGIEANQVRHYVLRMGSTSNSQIADTSHFFSAIEAHAPGSLIRALDDNFMMGSLGQSRFIIFKVNSFENAFPGMLEWEKNLVADLSPFFATNSLVKAIPNPSVFKDVTFRNKGARVISAVEEGVEARPVIVYSFFDTRILIITDNLDTLKILIDRLTAELLSR